MTEEKITITKKQSLLLSTMALELDVSTNEILDIAIKLMFENHKINKILGNCAQSQIDAISKWSNNQG